MSRFFGLIALLAIMPLAVAEESTRESRLADYLSAAKFVGKFSVDGKPDDRPLKSEQYTISKCEKLPEPDMYRLTARIKYGKVDSEVPLDIKILWAGNTPVMTLDALWIPGMGTFSARVLIHSDRYAGTWQHDQVGGHLFGTIENESSAQENTEQENSEQKNTEQEQAGSEQE